MGAYIRRLGVIAVSVTLLLAVALVSAGTILVNSSGTINTSQLANGRINRNGVTSGCAPAKSFPGAFNVGTSYGYTVEGPFGPVAAGGCITVTWTSGSITYNVHPVAFLNGFDPVFSANAANYLGDPGTSSTYTFSFPVSAGDTFVLVFENTSSVEAVGYTYSFSYEGVTAEAGNASPIEAINDGRLNRFDIAASLAVYPASYADGLGLHLYAIDADGAGTLALEVTPAMIAAVPELPAENTLIASTPDGGVALYRLFTGEFQLNVAPDYAIVFSQLETLADYYHP